MYNTYNAREFDPLAFYTRKAKTMTLDELLWAISDVTKSLEICAHSAEYSRKLWAEFDAYTVESHNRRVK